MLSDIQQDLKESFEKAIASLKRDMARIRTGRANASLLDSVRVNYYGTPTPLSQVANIKVPEPRLITIAPYERNLLGDIEKAIHASDLGLNPNNDGNLIRLPIPPLTGERRVELAKVARKAGEDAKIAVRNARRDANEMLKSLQKDGELSEDELHRGTASVQTATDEAVAEIDRIVAAKEKEITEV